MLTPIQMPTPIADADADADADTDADTDADGMFFEASGTYNGKKMDVSCDEKTASYKFMGAVAGTSINLMCTDITSGYGVTINVIDGKVNTYTDCSVYNGVQVTNTSPFSYVACSITKPTTFELDITEFAEDSKGAVTWAGTFEMVADDTVNDTDVSGSFRGVSYAPDAVGIGDAPRLAPIGARSAMLARYEDRQYGSE